MNIPIENSSFKSFPIEFKEINPEDFKYIFTPSGERIERTENSFIIENNEEKIIVTPDDEGYINDVFQESIDINHKNTVIVNAAVGQGKSYAIIQTLKKYYDIMQNGGQKYMIFVVSPFVSLVKQYCNDIEEAGVPPEQIYSYDSLGRESNIPYLNKVVQVITANTLLGNPGEDGFKNSEVKREYLNRLVFHCERNDIKVVFIYDEIHDSYHNFKQEYIFNLWKWKNVIHKNYVLSATYNEASKVVIEYLAELTDFKIQIIESKRVRFPQKQSSLHLHYSNAHNFTSSTKEIKSVINELIFRGKEIDILCYSKSLAKGIIDTKGDLGKLLHDYTSGEIKDCTSELPSNQREENEPPENQYDNTKCNVGTNFKTGISIKKENHAFVIIMPPRSTILPFKNLFGVFSGGINSVIQALARQRWQGEIHIVLPKPNKFNFTSLRYSDMSEIQKKEFANYYSLINYYKTPDKLVDYIKLNRQDFFMREFYENKLRGNLNREIDYVEGELFRIGLPRLKYPTYQEFKLERGEEYLANEFPIFGEDISAYVTYASLSNQFVNCALKEINFAPVVLFKEGEIQRKLASIFESVFGKDYYDSFGISSNFKMFYLDVKNTLFKDYQLKYEKLVNNEKKIYNIKEGSNLSKNFEIQLLKFTHKLKNPNRYNVFQDEDYSRSNYFLDCMSYSKNISTELLEDNYKNRVRFYQLLNGFREKLINSIQEYQRGSGHYYYTPANYYEGFLNDEDKLFFREMLNLIKYDNLLENKVFEFKRRFEDNRTLKKKLKTFYSILVEDFLIVEQRQRDPSINCFGRRRNVKVVSAINIIPSSNSIINLIETQDYINLD